jgi:lipopolysaccharide transport system ATP-binding protein
MLFRVHPKIENPLPEFQDRYLGQFMAASIKLSHVNKKYRIGQAPLSLRSVFTGKRPGQEERFHWAVKDLSFELLPGEAMGIIGPNGAGKTTILKLLSKVTYPTSGQIQLNGRFSALIELGAGFHPELTGRENIYLNGTILGMRRSEVNARFDEIVDFAGIGKYLDTPVKRYSSGMYARLGFAVAAHVNSEILLVDEVLAVGDMAFQKKCYERMVQLIKDGTTLIFVSHNLRAIQRVCPQCLVMYRGNPVFNGPSPEAVAEYSNILRLAASEQNQDGFELLEGGGISQRIMTHGAVIEEVHILREDGQPSATFVSGENVRVRAKITFHQDAPSPIFACTIRLPEGQVVYDYTTHWAEMDTPDFEADKVIVVEYPMKLNLTAGIYHVGVNLAYNDLTRYYDRIDSALTFVVTGGNGARGFADLQSNFQIVKVEEADLQEVSD